MDKNYVITTVGVFIFLIIACSVLSFGVPIFHRYQAIKYAQNQVLLNEIQIDRKSTRLNSSHIQKSRMPSSA